MNLKELKQKFQLKELEVFEQEYSSYSLSYQANEIKQTEIDNAKGTSIRVITNENKPGISTSYGISNTEELIADSINISKYYQETKISLPKNTIKTEDKSYIEDTNNIFNIFKKHGDEIIKQIKSHIKSNTILIDLSFDYSTISEKLSNANDLSYSTKSSASSFSVNLRETEENNFIEIYSSISDLKQPDYNSTIQEVVNFYNLSKKTTPVTNGKFPIFFTSRATKDLLDIIELALNGKMVNQQSSPWTSKLNQKVLSEKISLKQDPTFGMMARQLDDEGVEINPFFLIENGILRNFYFDLVTASKSKGFSSTGNGFKPSLGSLPEPSLLNFILNEGNKSDEEIIQSVDYGLIVDQIMGGLTTNISGDLSCNIDLGFLINKGEITGRVKDTMISGNIYNALNNVIEISNNSKWYSSSYYNPAILVDGFTITA